MSIHWSHQCSTESLDSDSATIGLDQALVLLGREEQRHALALHSVPTNKRLSNGPRQGSRISFVVVDGGVMVLGEMDSEQALTCPTGGETGLPFQIAVGALN